ncbi:MAG: hypothetical protein ACOX7C_06795 [Brevefilum sp.]|jgi:hypothetical protein
MYDLNLIPINQKHGEPLREYTGFIASSPPRRAARNRADELLILSLTLKEPDLVTSEVQNQWLQGLVEDYYKNNGSVTLVLRSLVETINQAMLEMNLRIVREGKAIRGAINLATIQRRGVYIVQSGITHAYVLSHDGLQHFTDQSMSDRGLGLNRTPTVRYFRAEPGPGAYLFMAEHPPSTWTEEWLAKDGFPDVDQLRRRLLHQAPTTFRVDMVEILRGEGKIKTILPQARPVKETDGIILSDEIAETLDEIEAPVSLEEVIVEDELAEEISETRKTKVYEEEETVLDSFEEPALISEDEIDETLPKIIDELPETELTAQETQHEEALVEAPPRTTSLLPASERLESEESRKEYTSPQRAMKKETPVTQSAEGPATPTIKQKMGNFKEEGIQGLAKFFSGWRRFQEKMQFFARKMVARFSPEHAESALQLSRGTLVLIALIVPLIVTGIAVGVYLARGKTLQYNYYYERARLASEYALAAQDPDVARNQWQEAVAYLDSAEQFRKTDELIALRFDADEALDGLDGVVRLSYRPAITSALKSEINITRIVSYGVDLYLLNSTSGHVIHATRGSQGYNIDSEFVCGAGNFSGGALDVLVDMVSLPINNPYQAHILGIDSLGNVAYCSPGQSPVVQALPSFGTDVGSIEKIIYENNVLYILNSANNSFWAYAATNGQFLDPPYRFFEKAQAGEIPDLSRVVDLAINGLELYFLRQDGQLINCVYTGLPGNPVTCEDPVTYIDGRPGKEEHSVTLPASNFTEVVYTSPPDPSVSILDASNADIYRFSLRFRLHQRLRPELGDYEIDSPIATAFTIGMDQVAYIAFGNQVFYAIVE